MLSYPLRGLAPGTLPVWPALAVHAGRVAASIWPAALVMVGLVLLRYREA